jgi:hypothetical protein
MKGGAKFSSYDAELVQSNEYRFVVELSPPASSRALDSVTTLRYPAGLLNIDQPNQAHAPNPAMTSLLQIDCHRRRVGDTFR